MTVPRDTADSSVGVSRISKRFGAQLVLDDVSLNLHSGSIMGLAGHNGSGKSTLIKIMAGYHQPEEGALREIGGHSFHWGTPPEAWAQRVRFVHQDLGLVGDLDAIENFALSRGFSTRWWGSIDWKRQRERTRSALERLGVDIDIRLPVTRLSAMEKTRLALARAFADLPEDGLLVLDEPTATLTVYEAEPLFETLHRMVSHGAGVLLVTHHLDEVMTHADHVTVLRDGRVVLEIVGIEEMTRGRLAEAIAGTRDDDLFVTEQGASSGGATRLEVKDISGGQTPSALADGSCWAKSSGSGGLGMAQAADELAPLIFGLAPRSGTVTVDGSIVPSHNVRSSSGSGRETCTLPAPRIGSVPRLNTRSVKM